MEVVKGRGYVYSIQYHIIWCVKYRRNVLNGQVEIRLKELLTQISKDNGFQILEMNMEEDYIHMLINCTPQHYIPNIIKAMKGVSARLLMKANAHRHWQRRSRLWLRAGATARQMRVRFAVVTPAPHPRQPARQLCERHRAESGGDHFEVSLTGT